MVGIIAATLAVELVLYAMLPSRRRVIRQRGRWL